MRRVFTLCCCALLFSVACQRSVDGRTAPAVGVDVLTLTVAQIREISGVDDFTRVLDDDQTVPDDVTPEGPCRALFDPGAAFGAEWIEFRVVADETDFLVDGPAALIASVSQTVVAYPDEETARQAFDHRTAQMNRCALLDVQYLDGVVSQPDRTAATYVNDGWTLTSVTKAAVIIDVSVGAVADADRIADQISRAIVDRIR